MRRTPTLGLCLVLLLGTITGTDPHAARAASPSLTAIRPTGGQRGTEIEVVLSGARLGDAQEILYYQGGITTLDLTKIDDNSVKARLAIAPDCPLGLHDIRLRTATGLSEHRVFSVGAYPELTEVEPNNDFDAPQAISLGSVVNGVADNEDIDYFVVEAKKGDRLSVEVEGIRLGISHFDPYVAILDARRFELASSDDRPLIRQDSGCGIIVPEDGSYIIAVRESAYAGNGNCLYRLHVGSHPRPAATVPAGGSPNETVEVAWIGDPAGTTTTAVSLPAADTVDVANFGIRARDDRGEAPHPNAFRLIALTNSLETEPNNAHDSANAVTIPVAVNGVIEQDGDHDFFSFQATKGQVLDIQCYARRLRSPLDGVMHVAVKGGAYIAGNDDSVGPDPVLRFQAPEDGEYVVYLHDQLLKGSPESFYRIEITPVEAKTSLSVPPEQIPLGTGVMAPVVPRGNRQAILINAARGDWSGDLALTLPDLPPGVTAEADVMAASQGVVPVLVSASPDAPIGHKLVRPEAVPADAGIKTQPSDFQAMAVLVLGANNVNFYNRSVDRLPVAVVEESPFSIEIVEPKVPLVRNGAMDLKVVAHRKEGFTAPIALSLPWLPPGVGASGGVSIPEGQNEALIPFNANAGAELRAWKVVVNGTAPTPTGPMMVSSQLARLEVSEPFVALTYQAAAVEQGKETDILVQVQKLKDFPGEAQVTLLGLPNKAVTEVKSITQDTTELVFHVKTEPDTPAGTHANLFCSVVVTMEGEPITHNLGSGTIRVDEPLPPKADAPAPPPVAEAAAQSAETPAKPLSRLEMLRQEAAGRAEAPQP